MQTETKPTERFSNRADDYRRFRPGYPPSLTSLMRDVCGLNPGALVADIGAGTGILTRLLLEAGFEVTAVEPNGPMRAAAEEDLGSDPRFHSIAAPAEATGLPAASFDAITVAQAFHWFDHQAARIEFQRLLRPAGWVFIIKNHRQVDTTPFARDFESLLKMLGERYENLTHRHGSASAQGIRDFFLPGAVTIAQFDNPHTMDWHGLRGRLLSVSYVPVKGEPGHEELLSALEQIFNKHARDGLVTFDQTTEIYYGHLV